MDIGKHPWSILCIITLFSLLNTQNIGAQCIDANSLAKPKSTTRKITIYIESDLAAELRAVTPTSLDANLTQLQVQTAILQIAET